MHSASFSIPCPPADARILLAALEVETDEGPEGTRTSIDATEDGLVFAITAEDLSGLRAAIHSALRLLDAAQRTLA